MRNLYYSLSLILLALFIYSCEEDHQTNPKQLEMSVSGQITDNFDQPLANTYIEAYRDIESQSQKGGNTLTSIEIIASDTTDENGYFMLESMPENLTGVMLRFNDEDFKPLDLSKVELSNENLKLKANRKEECDIQVLFEIEDQAGNAIDNAKIELKNGGKLKRKSLSDSLGKSTLKEVCPAKYDLQITKEGYAKISETIEIDEATEFSFAMKSSNTFDEDSCCGGKINFIFYDDNGNPLEGVKILLKKEGKAIEDPRTDSNGEATLDSLCEGTYKVIASKDGFDTIEYEIELGCDEEINSVKEMTEADDICCEGIAEIELKDKDGNPIDSAFVLLKQKGKKITQSISNGSGEVNFDELCEGVYSIVIEADGFKRMEWELEISCDEKYEISRTLEKVDDCCDGILEILIRDENGKPIKDAKILLIKDRKAIEDPRSDSEGKAIIDQLCEGEYILKVEHKDLETQEYKVNIGCNESETFEIKLSSKNEECCDASIFLNVQDKDGNPLDSTYVILKKEKTEIYKSFTGSKGRVQIDSVCEGKYSIVIEREGFERIEWEIEVDCDEYEITKKLVKNSDCCEAETKFTILDQDGDPLDSAEISIKKGGKTVRSGMTDSDGKLNFEELCEGNYKIVIEKPGYYGMEYEIFLDCKQAYEPTKTLTDKEEDCCDAFIQIKVKDMANDKAIQDAVVKYTLNGKIVAEGKSDVDGFFEKANLCKGKYKIEISKDGYNTQIFEWDIEKCKEFSETVKLKK